MAWLSDLSTWYYLLAWGSREQGNLQNSFDVVCTFNAKITMKGAFLKCMICPCFVFFSRNHHGQHHLFCKVQSTNHHLMPSCCIDIVAQRKHVLLQLGKKKKKSLCTDQYFCPHPKVSLILWVITWRILSGVHPHPTPTSSIQAAHNYNKPDRMCRKHHSAQQPELTRERTNRKWGSIMMTS